MKNQCDGCQAGFSLKKGLHYDKNGRIIMACTKGKYDTNKGK